MSSVAVPLAAPVRPPARAVRHRAAVRRRVWAWVRVLGGLAILGLLAWRLGTAGFTQGLRVIDGGTLLAALAIGALSTLCSAWRWSLVARGLGVRLPLGTAVADYYRALFLNAALPGGVLGDVHRAVRHGRDIGSVGRGVRAVILERTAGQVVLVALGLAVLLAAPVPALSPGRLAAAVPGAAVAVAVGVLVLAAVAGLRLRRATSRWARAVRAAGTEVRHGLLARRSWPGIVVLSAVALAGHLATFVVAARAAGASAPLTQLVPLALLALLAMVVPLNVGGWGPREGVSAWAFAAAGFGATQGLTTAVVYGLLAFVASLPGVGVLLRRWLAGRRRSGGRDRAASGAGREPLGERVPQQHHVADPAHLHQGGGAVGAPREPAVAHEPRRPRVADEERSDHQVQLVGDAGGEELRVHRFAALDHQPGHAAGVQVAEHPAQVNGLARVDHGRHLIEPLAGLVQRGAGTVDDLLGGSGGEEPGGRVELAPAGHGHLDRGGG
jgi:uncharacterized membrane protein YbhN (UPF0104 family)